MAGMQFPVTYQMLERISQFPESNQILEALLKLFRDLNIPVISENDLLHDQNENDNRDQTPDQDQSDTTDQSAEISSKKRKNLKYPERTKRKRTDQDFEMIDINSESFSSNSQCASQSIQTQNSQLLFLNRDHVEIIQSSQREFKEGLKAEIQKSDMNLIINPKEPFMEKFFHWKNMIQKKSEKAAKAAVRNIGQYLALFLEMEAIDNDLERITGCFNEKNFLDYVKKLDEVGYEKSSILCCQRSIVQFLDFLQSEYIMENDQKENMNFLKTVLKGQIHETRQLVHEQERIRKANLFEKFKDIQYREVQKIFRLKRTKLLWKNTKKDIVTNGVNERTFGIVLEYVICKIILKYGLRPEVLEKMKLCEWQNRMRNDKKAVRFSVTDNKNRNRGFLQFVILDRSDRNLFRFYHKYCRRTIISSDSEVRSDEFFIKRNGRPLIQAGNLVEIFQKRMGMEKIFTSRTVRHIISTQKDLGNLTSDEKDAIRFLLNHSDEVEKRIYKDPHPTRLIFALSGLKKLENIGEDNAIEDEDQVGPIEGGEGHEDNEGDGEMDEGGENEEVEEDEGDNEMVMEESAENEENERSETKGKKISENYSDEMKLNFVRNQNWPGLKRKYDLPGRKRGIFATVPFGEGQIMCDYNGKRILAYQHSQMMIDLEKEKKMDDFNLIDAYTFEFENTKTKEKFIIQAHEEQKGFGRLINHSKVHPNVYPVFQLIENQEIVFFKAKRRIKAGEELLWHYGPVWKDAEWFELCPCERKRCKNIYDKWVTEKGNGNN